MSSTYTLPKTSSTNDGSINNTIINLPENANYTSSPIPIPKTTISTGDPPPETIQSSPSSSFSSSNNIMYMIIGIIVCFLSIVSSIGFYFMKNK